MRAFTALALLACTAIVSACQPEPEPPDLAAISRDFCAIFKRCADLDFTQGWANLEECESGTLVKFDEAKDISGACYDAYLARRTCVADYTTCEEYDMETEDCLSKSSDILQECGAF